MPCTVAISLDVLEVGTSNVIICVSFHVKTLISFDSATDSVKKLVSVSGNSSFFSSFPRKKLFSQKIFMLIQICIFINIISGVTCF